jgi:hypothetical protein
MDSHSVWGISLGELGRGLLSNSGQFEKNYPKKRPDRETRRPGEKETRRHSELPRIRGKR